MKRLSLALVAVVGIAPGLAVAKKKSASEAATAPAGKTGAKAPKDALLAAADDIARQVSALRGLALLKPLARGVLSRDEIGAKLKERMAKEYTPDEVNHEARVLKRVGLLPANADYEKLLLDLLMEQVAGFYDPFAAKLYIADWLPLEMQRPAMAHEIEHALQDQHFDLKKFASPIKDDGDRQIARSALVEGDGTAVMLEFQAQAMGLPLEQIPLLVQTMGKTLLEGGVGSTPQFNAAPRFVKETLLFPYLTGLTFVESQRKGGAPWSRIDDVFKNPPESTEQVIHPEKYAAHEHPMKVTPGPLTTLGARKEVRRDVFGELALQVLFGNAPAPSPSKKGAQEPTAVELAEKAAAGWGGDREVAYVDPAQPDAPPVVIDLSVWDSEAEAKEAEPVAQRLMAKLASDDAVKEDWLVTREGDKLVMIFGAPQGAGAKVTADVFKSWKIAKP